MYPKMLKMSTPIVNVPAAIEELSKLSRNAKIHLQDRIGNAMNAIRLSNQLGLSENVENAVMQLREELDKIKLFD